MTAPAREFDPTTTDEEHLLRALDADPGDRVALMALADLVRETDPNAADWLVWAWETEKRPDPDYSGKSYPAPSDPSQRYTGWWDSEPSPVYAYISCIPGRLKDHMYQSDPRPFGWRAFLFAACREPFNGGSWT